MNQRIAPIALVLLLALLLVVACSTLPTPASPKPTPLLTKPALTVIVPTDAPASPAPTLAPQSSAAVPTLALSPTAVPTIASTQTNVPSPAPTDKPGLYVSDLRIDPNPPVRGPELNFFATFVNAAGTVQNFKWLVYIYRSDTPNKSYGETSPLLTAIPTGTNPFKSNGYWKLPLGGPCEFFFARVAWLDQNNKPIEFTTPDGKVFNKDFTVCPPPAEAPTPTYAPPTPTPTPAPGFYVTDVRTDPNPPTRGSELKFYPTFVNTTGNVQTHRWNVYIFKTDEPTKSYGETTATTTTFQPSIISDVQSLGYWKLPLGGPCENFIVRVAFFNEKNQAVPFTNFENKTFEKTLSVCPP
jgi:hypothetical protein